MQAPEDVEAMLKLASLGWGAKRIANELGCSRQQAHHFLRRIPERIRQRLLQIHRRPNAGRTGFGLERRTCLHPCSSPERGQDGRELASRLSELLKAISAGTEVRRGSCATRKEWTDMTVPPEAETSGPSGTVVAEGPCRLTPAYSGNSACGLRTSFHRRAMPAGRVDLPLLGRDVAWLARCPSCALPSAGGPTSIGA